MHLQTKIMASMKPKYINMCFFSGNNAGVHNFPRCSQRHDFHLEYVL